MSALPLHPATTPTPLAPALLEDLLSADLSLSDIARRHNLSLSDLLVHLSSTPADAQLATLHTLAADRIRLLATHLLPQSLHTLSRILNAFNTDAHPSTSTAALPPSPAPAGEVSERSEDGGGVSVPPPASIPRSQDPSIPFSPPPRPESARRAASTILRLANFRPRRLHAQAERLFPAPAQPNPDSTSAPLPPPPTRAPTTQRPTSLRPTTSPPTTPTSPPPPGPSSPLPAILTPLTSGPHTHRSPRTLLASAGAAAQPP